MIEGHSAGGRACRPKAPDAAGDPGLNSRPSSANLGLPMRLLKSTFAQVLAAILVAAILIGIALAMNNRYSKWSNQKQITFNQLQGVTHVVYENADSAATKAYGLEQIRKQEREMIAVLDAKPYHLPLTATERRLRDMCVNELIGKPLSDH